MKTVGGCSYRKIARGREDDGRERVHEYDSTSIMTPRKGFSNGSNDGLSHAEVAEQVQHEPLLECEQRVELLLRFDGLLFEASRASSQATSAGASTSALHCTLFSAYSSSERRSTSRGRGEREKMRNHSRVSPL